MNSTGKKHRSSGGMTRRAKAMGKHARRKPSHFQFPWSLERRLRRVGWSIFEKAPGHHIEVDDETKEGIVKEAGKILLPIIGGLGKAIGKLFKGKGSSWDGAGEGVHGWFTNFGEQRFLDWMRENHPDGFGSLDQVRSLLCVFHYPSGMIKRNSQWDVDHHNYVSGVTEQAYAAMGIDYDRTLATSEPNKVPNWVMLPGGGTPGVPQAAVDELKDAADRVANGTGTAADRTLLELLKDAGHDIAQAVAQGATEGTNDAGGVTVNAGVDMGKMLPWIIGGLLVAVAVYMLVSKPPTS